MGQNFMYKAGSGHAEPFKVSGHPYLYRGTFSAALAVQEEVITFPSVTKSVLLVNENSNDSSVILRLHFSSRVGNTHVVAADGTGANIPLKYGESISIDLKCRTVYVSRDALVAGSVSYYILVGELSGVKEEHPLSGSGINI